MHTIKQSPNKYKIIWIKNFAFDLKNFISKIKLEKSVKF